MLIRNIKSNLKDVGDKVKVSDVYAGEWHEVCGFNEGADADISKHFSDPPEEANIINNAPDSTTDYDGDSAVIFKYSDTDLEILRTARQYPDAISYGVYKWKDCFLKDDAYFYFRVNNPGNRHVMITNLETIKRVDLERKSKEMIQSAN